MRRLLAWCAAVLLAAGALVSSAAGHGFEPSVEQLDDESVLALVDSTPMTAGELKTLLGLRTAPYRPGQVVFFGLGDLLRAARLAPVYDQLAAQARAEQLELTDADRERIDAMTREYARRMLYRERILGALDEPTPQQLLALYEAVRHEYFRTPDKLVLREMTFPFATPDEEAEAHAQAQRAAARIDAGESFLNVAREMAGQAGGASSRIIIPETDLRTPPEVVAVFHELADKQTSAPFRSAGAWHIVYRQFHTPAGFIPFESTIDILAAMHSRRQREEAVARFFRELTADVNLFRIHAENLVGEGELALTSDVLLSVAGRTFTRGDLIAAGGWALSREVSVRQQELRDVALRLGPVHDALADWVAQREGFLERPAVVRYRDRLEDTLLVRTLLLRGIDTASLEPTEDEVLAAWRQGMAANPEAPGMVHYDSLAAWGPADQRADLARRLATVETYDAFAALARSLYNGPLTISWGTRLRDFVVEAPEPVRDAVRAGRAHGLAGPVLDDNQLEAWWINTAHPEREPTARELAIARENLRTNLVQDQIELLLDEASEAIVVEDMLSNPDGITP